MSFVNDLSIDNPAPVGYVAPDWPSLYWPFPINGDQGYYLYDASDIWRFTVLWTLLFFGTLHLVTSAYACVIQRRSWKVIWLAPLVCVGLGGIEAVLAGSIVGGLLGAVYNAGYFRMSTWIPFVWAGIITLGLILSSFAIQGGL